VETGSGIDSPLSRLLHNMQRRVPLGYQPRPSTLDGPVRLPNIRLGARCY